MVKRIDEKHPDMAAVNVAREKFKQLRQRLKETEVKLDTAQGTYAREMARSAQERIDDQATALLANGHLDVITRNDIERLANEITTLKTAIRKQQELVDGASAKVSKLLHVANRDTYLAIEKRITRAILELAAANQEEISFFSELRDAGCSSISFRPMAVKTVGVLADTQSVANFHMAEVKEFIPEILR